MLYPKDGKSTVIAAMIKSVSRPIAVQRCFITICDSNTNAALLLSQLYYWAPRSAHDDAWIFKSRAEWEEETGLKRWKLEGARKVLRDLRLVEERHAYMPNRTWYRLDIDRLMELMEQTFEIKRDNFEPETPMPPPPQKQSRSEKLKVDIEKMRALQAEIEGKSPI